jgi:hypothetical protein
VALKLVVNPLVDWIWCGFMLLALGTAITLLPESVLAPVGVRLPAGAGGASPAGTQGTAGATTVLVVIGLGLILGLASPAQAAVDPEFIKREQKWIETNTLCPCNCRHLLGSCGGECAPGPEYRAKVHAMLEAGKSREEIIAFLGGSSALASPPDHGFNRLAWALPYGLGAFGAGALVFGAWRFSRRPPSGPNQPPAGPADRDLEDRLEDELSRIDE